MFDIYYLDNSITKAKPTLKDCNKISVVASSESEARADFAIWNTERIFKVIER